MLQSMCSLPLPMRPKTGRISLFCWFSKWFWRRRAVCLARRRRRADGVGAAASARGLARYRYVHLDKRANYVSRDQPSAHELTYHTGQPSPAPGVRSASASGHCLRIPLGTDPKSPTGTTGSFPRMDSTGITYSTGFFGSSSYRTRDPTDSNQAA